MNKRNIIIALVIITGAFFFFSRQKTSERSDVVIVHEVDAPAEKKTSAPLPVDPTPQPPAATQTSVPSQRATLSPELEEVLNNLPEIEDLKDLTTDEVHHTPPVVKDGGVAVGEVIGQAQQDASQREPTLHFLLQCAEKDDVVPAIRAVCWNQLLNKIPEWNIFIPVADAKVPEDIKNLAMKLE